MGRKLRLKTYKKWRKIKFGYSGQGVEITYYGAKHRVGLQWGDVEGVFQGIWHGPGPARKSTRKFYILELDDFSGAQLGVVNLAIYPEGSTSSNPKILISLDADELDDEFGYKKWEKWGPQHLATQLLEASKK